MLMVSSWYLEVQVLRTGSKWADRKRPLCRDVQKRLNRSRCRLGYELVGPMKHVLEGAQIPMLRAIIRGKGMPAHVRRHSGVQKWLNPYRFTVWVVDPGGPKEA